MLILLGVCRETGTKDLTLTSASTSAVTCSKARVRACPCRHHSLCAVIDAAQSTGCSLSRGP